MPSKKQLDAQDPTWNLGTLPTTEINFGWEFVWHCHLLGHEEKNIMRPMALAVAPEAPSRLTAVWSNPNMDLSWTDNLLNTNGFTLQRAENCSFTTGVVPRTLVKVTAYTDTTAVATGLTTTGYLPPPQSEALSSAIRR